MLPKYSDLVRKCLQNRLYKVQKLHEFHKIALTSWANYQNINNSNYVINVGGYNPCKDNNIYYISPSNCCQYDFGLQGGWLTTEGQRISDILSHLLLGYIDRAYHYLHANKPDKKPCPVADYMILSWNKNTNKEWWRKQEFLYKKLKGADV